MCYGGHEERIEGYVYMDGAKVSGGRLKFKTPPDDPTTVKWCPVGADGSYYIQLDQTEWKVRYRGGGVGYDTSPGTVVINEAPGGLPCHQDFDVLTEMMAGTVTGSRAPGPQSLEFTPSEPEAHEGGSIKLWTSPDGTFTVHLPKGDHTLSVNGEAPKRIRLDGHVVQVVEARIRALDIEVDEFRTDPPPAHEEE